MMDPIVVSIPIGSLGTANREVLHVPSTHGGITLTAAYVVCGSTSTCVMSLNNNGTSPGTAISSNVGTLPVASSTLTANVPAAMTISTAYQAKNTWVAVQSVSGITDANAQLVLEYKFGK